MKISVNLFITPYQKPCDFLIGTKKAITIICVAIIMATAGIDVQAETQAPVGWSTIFNQRYIQDFEGSTSGITPGFGDISHITTNDAIEGNVSIILREPTGDAENTWLFFWAHPQRPFLPNTIISVEFDYRVLKDPFGQGIFALYFPRALVGEEYQPSRPGHTMDEPAQVSGVFSAGNLLGDLLEDPGNIAMVVDEGVELIIDNYAIYRSDPFEISEQPENWKFLKFTQFPRLGNYFERGGNTWSYQPGCKDGQPYQYKVDEVENKVAFSDVVAGFKCTGQDPDFGRRMRKKNPGILLMSYEYAWDAGAFDTPSYEESTIDMHQKLLSGVEEDWFAKDTSGNDIIVPDWFNSKLMNISEYCPKANGATWNDYNLSYLVNTVSKLGVWDGIFLDNLFGRIHPEIPNYNDPSLLEFDLNLNGVRDETPAYISEITRNAAIQFLESLRDKVGDLEIIMGNTGATPEIALAPYVNGYVFQCWSDAWGSGSEKKSEGGWRIAFDIYLQMLSKSISPKIVIIEGCGSRVRPEDNTYPGCNITDENYQAHRFMMGTTLLGDGFYEYDLWESGSAPHWFDEYTVNENGVAVEDRKYKGYLGQPIGDAVELKSPATIIWEEDFETGVIPDEMSGDLGVYVSKEANDLISGGASLIIYEPDHTQISYTEIRTLSDKIIFEPGKTYLIDFDWSIIETIDGNVFVTMNGLDYSPSMTLPGVVAGDAGKVHFPITIDSSDQISLGISLNDGGGKIAIDNIRISEGGVGPWRRDFENGFVLVNPLNKPYTFSVTELSGSFNRNQIKRILGTQDPIINNGQAVTETLTLQPFDAIILLTGIKQLPVSFTISPESCIFSQCEIGASSSKTITITNTGEKSIQLLSKIENTSDHQHFSIANDTCSGSSIDPLTKCTVQIMFSPLSTGIKKAQFITRTDQSGTPSLSVDLSGEAISPPDSGGGGGGCFISTTNE